MRYQLPTGTYIEINIDTYLSLSDKELSLYISNNHNQGLGGNVYDDPFANSVLKYGEDHSDDYCEDFIEEEIEDLLSIDFDDKIMDTDFINIDELEI